MKKKKSIDVEKEVDWIIKNGLQFAEGRFGHQVVVIKDRKVIFRVRGDEKPVIPSVKSQQKDIEKALRWVKGKFGDPELVKLHTYDDDQTITTLHYKDGLILCVFGFTAL